jgi:hypothetical protein
LAVPVFWRFLAGERVAAGVDDDPSGFGHEDGRIHKDTTPAKD